MSMSLVFSTTTGGEQAEYAKGDDAEDEGGLFREVVLPLNAKELFDALWDARDRILEDEKAAGGSVNVLVC